MALVPPQVHEAYREAVATSLAPVFLVVAAIAALAFPLSWLLREAPLRRSVGAEGLGESFALPREASSLRELERMLSVLARRENRWRVYQRLAGRAGLSLAPPAVRLLVRLGERPPITVVALMRDYRIAPERLDAPLRRLREERLIDTGAGAWY